MAGPQLFAPKNNLLKTGTLLTASAGAGSQETGYSFSNVFNRFQGKPWRSQYQTFKISAGNNKIDFDIGTGLLTATLTSGDYRGAELAAEIGKQMTSAGGVVIGCTYNNDGSFTITKVTVGANLNLRVISNGAGGAATNRANSVYSTIHFTQSNDYTGALTYTGNADLPGTTGGLYVLTSSNNQLHYNDGTNRTATIPAGVYTAAELATEIAHQMNTTSALTVNGFSCLYFSFSLKFEIRRGAGTFTLRTTVSTNAIWSVIGYNTSGDKTGLLTYPADFVRINTEEALAPIDLGAASTLTFVAVAGTNIQDQANNLRLQANSSDSWTSPSQTIAPTAVFDDPVNGKGWAYWVISQSFRYWRARVIDITNPSGFVQIGIIIGGIAGALTQLGTNYQLKTGYQRRRVNSEKGLTDTDATYGEIKSNHFEMGMQFQKIIQADKNYLDELINEVGDIGSFAILLDSTGQTTPKFLWANFVSIPEFKEFAPGPGGSIWQCDDFGVRESA